MLIDSEIKDIKDKFGKVIQYSQEITKDMNVDPLFDQWYAAKSKFIDRIAAAKKEKPDCGNSSFIYEFPKMTFGLDSQTRMSKVEGWIDFIEEYLIAKNGYSSIDIEFIGFLRQNKDTFFENKVSHKHTVALTKEVIPEGIKLLKAFKFFYHGQLLEDIQNKASMVIQENSITGQLCVSVHPLDFLSASETTYDWRSCHSLDGEYRSGNMAYMVDDCTVMCYLKSEDEKELPRFPESVPWNSKKWRMYLFLNQEGVVVWGGRQYPYASASLANKVLHEIVPIISGIRDYTPMWYGGKVFNWEDWEEELQPIQGGREKYIDIQGLLFNKNSVISSGSTLFYNDLLFSTKYTPVYSYNTHIKSNYHLDDRIDNRSDLKALHIKIGNRPLCPCCGRNVVDYSDEMVCPVCDAEYGTQENEEFIFCHGCGARIWKEDAHWDENSELYYCDGCWDWEYGYNEEEGY